ncbi:MAG: hypothetical protein ABIN94_01440 [Ferruginibacter sp.]
MDSSLTQNYIDGTTKIKAVLRKDAKEKTLFLSEQVGFKATPENKSMSNYLFVF